jgi:hypothetical protein
MEVVWLSVPELAMNCTVDVLATAAGHAAKPTCWDVPGIRLKDEGEATTPACIPLTVTFIDPENPFRAVADSVAGCPLPPPVRLTLTTFAIIEKSGVLIDVKPLLQPPVKPPVTRIASQHSRTHHAWDITLVILLYALECILSSICPRIFATHSSFAGFQSELVAGAAEPSTSGAKKESNAQLIPGKNRVSRQQRADTRQGAGLQ